MNDVELLSVLREPLNKPSLSRDRRHSGWSKERKLMPHDSSRQTIASQQIARCF